MKVRTAVEKEREEKGVKKWSKVRKKKEVTF